VNLRAIPDLVVAGRAVPLVFGKGQFESGVAAKVLREFAQDPFPYLRRPCQKNRGKKMKLARFALNGGQGLLYF